MVDPDLDHWKELSKSIRPEIRFREGDAFLSPAMPQILIIGAVEVIDRDTNQAKPRRKHANISIHVLAATAVIITGICRSIEAFVKANVKRGATLLTDGHASYRD